MVGSYNRIMDVEKCEFPANVEDVGVSVPLRVDTCIKCIRGKRGHGSRVTDGEDAGAAAIWTAP